MRNPRRGPAPARYLLDSEHSSVGLDRFPVDRSVLSLKGEPFMRRILMIAATTLLTEGALAGAPQTVTLDVKNMYCDLCPVTVRKSLERVPGVADAKVDFAQKTATVKFDPDKATAAVLVKATTEAGFPSAIRK
jgi:mercuric ion binding protein